MNNHKMTTSMLRGHIGKTMLKTFLILVFTFIANIAFASDGVVQYDKNTSGIICVADIETACNDNDNDIELDVAIPLYFRDIFFAVTLSAVSPPAYIALVSHGLMTIRGPP